MDLAVFTDDEAKRFVAHGVGDPQSDLELAWEVLYRREPELYDRLAAAERLHPGVMAWLPDRVSRIVEVGAGTGRLTLELAARTDELMAIEPAAPLRGILSQKLARQTGGHRAVVSGGFFDRLPVDDAWADLVITCSAFTPSPGHGGEAGLSEMERVCKPGGLVVIVWPNHLDWLAARGYRYQCFTGEVFVEFSSRLDAVELSEIFYPSAAAAVRRSRERRFSYEALGINPPRDVAFKGTAE
jgi:SAM-dependent methyltransferase